MPTTQVAQDRRQPDEPADDDDDDGGPEQDEDQLQRLRHRADAEAGTCDARSTVARATCAAASARHGRRDCSTTRRTIRAAPAGERREASVILDAMNALAAPAAAPRPPSTRRARSRSRATCSPPRPHAIAALSQRLGDAVRRRRRADAPLPRPRRRVRHRQVGPHRAQARGDARLHRHARRSSCIPAEASHGDLGMITPDDVVLMLSNSGETDELVLLTPHLKRQGASDHRAHRQRAARRSRRPPTCTSTPRSTPRPARWASRRRRARRRRWRWATRWRSRCSTRAASRSRISPARTPAARSAAGCSRACAT